MSAPHFTPSLFTFLRGLAKNNTKEWFTAHKDDYEAHVKEPMLRFIADLEPRMAKISPRIEVIPKVVGGSMQRINRDTRFSKDKSPYKACASAMFGHDKAGELKLGYHLAIMPGSIKAYVGLWEPDGPVLEKVRTRIMVKPDEWTKAIGGAFGKSHTFEGESLKKPPKIDGCVIEADHPLVEDLKRKSHAACTTFTEKDVTSAKFLDEYVASVKAGVPLMAFLCKATGMAF